MSAVGSSVQDGDLGRGVEPGDMLGELADIVQSLQHRAAGELCCPRGRQIPADRGLTGVFHPADERIQSLAWRDELEPECPPGRQVTVHQIAQPAHRGHLPNDAAAGHSGARAVSRFLSTLA